MSTPLPLSGVPALVLGAGLGTRLRPFTEHVPKPVVPLLGRPLIGYALARLYAAGCQDAWVNVHHRPDRLKAVLDAWVQRRLLRMKVRWSVEQPAVLGTGGALRKIEDALCGSGGPFLLMNGDTVVGADLPGMIAAHRANREAHGTVATLFCMPRPDAATYGAVRVDATGRVVDMAGLGRPPGTTDEEVQAATPTVFCGIHVIEPEVVAALPPGGFSGIVRQGYAPLIQAGADVRGVLAPAGVVFHDVGTPARYLDAQAALLEGPSFLPTADGVDPRVALFQEASYAVDAAGREYGSPDAVEGLARATLEAPFFFGPRNTVGAGATIGPDATIGALNTIGAGARVQDAALWSQVDVADGEALRGVMAAKLGGERVVVDGRPT